MEKRFPTKNIVSFISQTPLFKPCGREGLFKIVDSAEQSSHKSKDTILAAGRPVSGLGVLLRGRASLMLVDATSGSQTRIEQLSPGSFFGEVGLLLGGASPLAVVADEDCLTLTIAQQDMDALLKRNSEVGIALAKRLSSRFVQLSLLGAQGASGAGDGTPPASTERADDSAQARKKEGEIIWVDVADYDLSPDVIQMVPAQLIKKHRLLPLTMKDKKLVVGMVNPRSMEGIQELRRVLHTVDPEVVAISMDDFSQTFVRLKLDAAEIKVKKQGSGRNVQMTYAVDQDKEAENAHLYIGGEVVTLLDDVLVEGIDLGASDIHIEPENIGVKVRYRVHGNLIERKDFLASSYAAPIIARIKVLAELDITDRRKPQDGRITAQMGRRELNLRVSTMPVARGEKAVIRIIDSSDAMRPLSQIIVNASLEKAVRSSLSEPYGAIVVAGPTGSGKSSTLYSMLNERRVARPDNSVVTVEDPIEYLLQGVTQVQVVPRAGFGFAHALYGMLRQDPDVIMIGELRDRDTTTIMVEAALTGHLVLCSIHGNHATAVIQRLQHLGTNPVMLSQALSIVIVQRLARRLCPNCVSEGDVAPALLDNLVERNIIARAGGMKLARPVGCDACDKTGYLGRVAVQEIMNFDETLRIALANEATPDELIATAKERKRFFSFAQAASHLMARRIIAPSDALLLVAD